MLRLSLAAPRFFSPVAILFAAFAVGSADSQAAEKVDFRRDIKPILSNHCFTCHGPDAGQRQADLRLDVREDAMAAIEPGDADSSEMIARVTSLDDEEVMPPPKSNKPKLTARQVDLLRRWIDEGANYDVHWSYVLPERPEFPEVNQKNWADTPLDRFVAAGQESQKLQAAVEADRRVLARRLYFDLIGLPPTPAEVDAFVHDASTDAYEKLVDRLLASEHYGERMAMYWLDAVRYADTNGIHGDNHRDHAPYRDYVIRAFNENMPFDQFTIEQLAGDLLPDATIWQKVASGYNRLNMTTREGGAQAKEYMAKYAADRVRNASTVWMGITLGCCECHDHKFDPFTMKDFYSFASFFADVKETAVGTQGNSIKVPPGNLPQRLAELDKQIKDLETQLAAETAKIGAQQSSWEQEVLANIESGNIEWLPIAPIRTESSGGATLVLQDDYSVLSTGENPAKDNYDVTLHTDLAEITGIALEALTHPSLAGQGLARGNGNFVLTAFEVAVLGAGEKETTPVKIKASEADFEQKGFPVKNALDGKSNTGWAVSGHEKKNENRRAVFVFDRPIPGGPGTRISLQLKHESQHSQHNIGRFRFSLTKHKSPSLKRNSIPADLFVLLRIPPDKRTDEQKAAIAAHHQSLAPQLESLRNRLAEARNQHKATADAGTPVLVTVAGSLREMRILPRGNWLDDSGTLVQPDTPDSLFDLGIADRHRNRLDLANWFVARDNPLTARVFVNRLWKICFGEGLVTTLDDFGSQGDFPSHPELLDWLAVEFMESGWDVKHMMKTILMSRAYRQSSLATAGQRQQDPKNRWLARQNRFRLDAEMVRDNALAVSGLLVRDFGGVSVKPYQPAGYWSHLNFPRRTYKHDSGESQYRRGLYTYWCRTFLHPSLLAFDAPSREESCVARPRSNTPLQALVLLNDPTYVEAARVFAGRMIREAGTTPAERIDFAFRQALNRPPREAELEILLALVEKHRIQYREDPAAAATIAGVGESKVTESLDKVELAAWTSVARAILNLHETITRY